MKLLKHKSAWAGVVYFLILLSIALLIRDIPNQADAFITLQQMIISSPSMGDPPGFAKAAIDIAVNGWASSAKDWILNSWPAGFILLEALIIKVLGLNAPVILVLQVLSAALFSIVLALLYSFLSAHIRSRLVFILPLLIFAFPVSRVFLLQPTGVTLGVNLSIGFFLAGILLALRSVQRGSFRVAVYAGLCVALSAYFYSQFETILLALTGWGVLLIVAAQSAYFRNRFEPQLFKSVARTIAIVLLVAHAATMPWKVYQKISQDRSVWANAVAVDFAAAVKTSELLDDAGAGFVVEGGGNIVCRIDPSTCGDTANAKKLFVKTFIAHPVEWYSIKLGVIGKYWFSSAQNWVSVSAKSTPLDYVTNGLILIALIALVTLLFTRKVRYHESWLLLIWFNLSLFSAYLLMFTVQRFEVRYFYFPKIVAITMVLMVASLHLNERAIKATCNRLIDFVRKAGRDLYDFLRDDSTGAYHRDLPGNNATSPISLLKRESLWVGAIYFVILLSIALWVRDIPNQKDAFVTIQQLIVTSEYGDPASLAKAAVDVAENGWVSKANEWVICAWPPGFVLLEALIIKTFGPDAPVILVLQILAAALFSVVLALLYNFMSAHVRSKAVFILPLLIFAFPVSRVFLLQPAGVIFGENLAIGFFLIFVFLALHAAARNSLRYAVYAGMSLATAAYLRSQFEFFLMALTGWGAVLIIAAQLTWVRKLIEPTFVKSAFRTMVVALLVAQVSSIPWRAYHWINQGSPYWIETYFLTAVTTSESLESKGAGYVVAGGGNLVCRIDPTTCGDETHANQLLLKTIISHPVEWYSLKYDLIGKYWFSSVQNWVTVSVESTLLDFVTNGIILIALIGIVILLFASRRVIPHSLWVLLIWFNASLYSGYLLIFTITHFETRYFYFPKIAGITMVLMIGSLYFSVIKKRPDNNKMHRAR